MDVAEKPKRHPHRKDYTDAEVDAGLTAYALTSGKKHKAAELVETLGYKFPAETIRSWAERTHPERYQKIREDVAPRLQTQMADVHQALADSAAEIEAEAGAKLQDRLKAGNVEDRDLGNIYKNAAIVSGIHTEKAELLNGRPTSRPTRSADEVLRKLKARRVLADGSEEEVVAEESVPALGDGVAPFDS